MTEKRHLLFYDDSSEFGGHEVQTLQALRYLTRQPELRLSFMYHPSNRRLSEHLQSLHNTEGRLNLYASPAPSRSFQAIRNLFERNAIARLAQRFQEIGPDCIVVVQGAIGISSRGLLAARRAGIRAISYLPLAQSMRLIGAQLAGLRDSLNRRLYLLPDAYITSNQSCRQSLERYGVRVPIELVYYSLNADRLIRRPKLEARRELGLNEHGYIAAIIGRINFQHKGHDFLLRALNRYRDQLGDLKLLIVGDGPDQAALHTQVTQSRIAERVIFQPWCEDLSTIYSALDLLIIPSRYEGFPTVLLEALHFGVPVIASDRDGMAEILPQRWRFPFGDEESLVQSLLYVQTEDQTENLCCCRAMLESEQYRRPFELRFHEALCRLIGTDLGVSHVS